MYRRILGRGQEAWNDWRSQNPDIRPSLRKVDLSYSNLAGYNLTEVNLVGANLEGVDLMEAVLCEANLGLANLILADLSGANLRRANLFMTQFLGSKLPGADLTGAILVSTSMVNSNVYDVNFHDSTMATCNFGNLDLSQARGLSGVVHWGPSTIGIDTLYRSRGRIPVEFLRGAGVPDALIDYFLSLSQDALVISSCFISYSALDEEFASKLWNDLQDSGVRCWFAPRDLQVGSSIRSSIDEAIHVHDKLVVILSRRSIESKWVEKEVETAYEKERSLRVPVLFPLRLDDEVFDTKAAWAADLRRTRHIGDFRNWKDENLYRTAFRRLLRGLQQAANNSVQPGA